MTGGGHLPPTGSPVPTATVPDEATALACVTPPDLPEVNDLVEVVARASVVDEVDSMEDSTEVVASEAVSAAATAHTKQPSSP